MEIKNIKFINYFIDNIKNLSIKNKENLNPFLNFFYNELQESINYIDKKKNEIINKNTIPKNFNIINNTKFISDKIKNYINNNTKIYYTFSLIILSTKVRINFAFYNKNDKEEIQNYLYLILIWLYIGIKYKKNNCSDILNIYLFLTPFEKRISNSKILGPKNCNSGYSYACTLNNSICVFRKEELVKVVIHETFHALGLDFAYLNIPKIKKKFKKCFNINSNFNINESYAETWATIINTLLFCYFKLNKLNKINKKIFLDNSLIFLNLEKNFSVMQTIKILNNNNIEYCDIISQKKKNIYNEKTNVFAYYILKSILLINLSDFLLICKNHNYFNINNISKFTDLILKLYNCDDVINSYKLFQNNKIIYNKNLKMTICE